MCKNPLSWDEIKLMLDWFCLTRRNGSLPICFLVQGWILAKLQLSIYCILMLSLHLSKCLFSFGILFCRKSPMWAHLFRLCNNSSRGEVKIFLKQMGIIKGCTLGPCKIKSGNKNVWAKHFIISEKLYVIWYIRLD